MKGDFPVQAQAIYIDGLVQAPVAGGGRPGGDPLAEREHTKEPAFPTTSPRSVAALALPDGEEDASRAIPERKASPAAALDPRDSSDHHEIDAQSNWTANLLAVGAPSRLGAEISRFGAGLGLAALYGLALGARQGGLSLFRHAVGVPAAMVAVACLGVPALTIVLTLFNAPISPSRALSAAARAAAASGLVLGGLAPAAALFVVTSGSTGAAAIMGLLGLAVGGVIGMRVLIRDLKSALQGEQNAMTWAASGFALVGFAIFAVALALRVWWSSLPILNGGAS
jgi:hypothetical protein